MITFSKDRWLGNKWPAIEVYPTTTNFLPIMFHLSRKYNFPFPKIIDIVDGYTSDFKINKTKTIMHIDNWSFSFAFKDENIREMVLTELQSLPASYFEMDNKK